MPANAHLVRLNPLVDERLRGQVDTVFGLPTQNVQVAQLSTSLSACGGVSSFWFSGTIAHAVVRLCTHDEPTRAEDYSLRRLERAVLSGMGMGSCLSATAL